MLAPAEFTILQTAGFSCFFDPHTGSVRRVKVGDCEVLRGIYAAVRGPHWNTVRPVFSNFRTAGDGESFEVSFDADCRDKEAWFAWRGIIRGSAHELEFDFAGIARSTFQRNRIGLCVLHPLVECLGGPCEIVSPDGHVAQKTFPRAIAPHQPFTNIRMMRWTPADGVQAEILFEGDVFELEDQRNWTDASFKTYSTPLALPMPVQITAGSEVRQRVVLRLNTSPAALRASAPPLPEIRLTSSAPVARAPLGLCLTPEGEPLAGAAVEHLRRLQLAHLRVDLRLYRSGWEAEWERAQTDAAAIGAGLHAALFISDAMQEELAAFAAAAATGRAPVQLVLVFHRDEKSTPPHCFEEAQAQLGPSVEIAIGTDENFAELNRGRPPAGVPVCFSLNPQVHTFDEFSVVENLEGQPEAVLTAHEFSGRKVAVSPLLLQQRTSPPDPRLHTHFGAAWTVGSLARMLVLPELHSITYYETSGPAGVVAHELFPVFHVFAALAGWEQVQTVENTTPCEVAAVRLRRPGKGERLLVANLLSTARMVRIFAHASAVHHLGDDPQQPIASSNGHFDLSLGAYGVAVIDLA
jgi:hypothetical protein